MTSERTLEHAPIIRTSRELPNDVTSSKDRPLFPFTVSLGVAALSALITSFAFPSLAWWPLVFIGQIGLFLAIVKQGFWRGCTIGLVYGVVYFASLMQWLTLYLGPIPWIALALCLGLFTAFGIGVAAGVSKLLRWHSVINALCLAFILAGREVLTNNAPYGGLGWGRIGVALSGSPLQSIASWIGITGTSILVLWVSGILAYLLIDKRSPAPSEQLSRSPHTFSTKRLRTWRTSSITIGAACVVVLLAIAWFVPAWGSLQPSSHTLRIAAIQGNANAGLMANPEPGTFLNHQVQASQPVLKKQFDVMVWPENASDLDPFTNAYARQQVEAITRTTNRPLIFGAIRLTGNNLFNSSILWTPNGPQQVYDKQRPVPFAEYMPNRSFFHALAPSLVDLIRHNYAFGKAPGIMHVNHTSLGILICFESSIDKLVNNRVEKGAQILLVQSNNADFGHSVEAAQQFAITRMQAVATGRNVVNISTVASSAVVYPDGSVHHKLKDFAPGYFIADVPVVNGISPALVVNGWIEGLALIVLAGGGLTYLLSRWRARAAARRLCK